MPVSLIVSLNRGRVAYVGCPSPPSLETGVTVDVVERRVLADGDAVTDAGSAVAALERTIEAVELQGIDCAVVRASTGPDADAPAGDADGSSAAGSAGASAAGSEGAPAANAEDAAGATVPGPALVTALRHAGPSVPILYVTDEPDGEAAASATRAGATEYLVAGSESGPTLPDRIAALAADDPDATGHTPADETDVPAATGTDQPQSHESPVSTATEPSLDPLAEIDDPIDATGGPGPSTAGRLDRLLETGRDALGVEYAAVARVEDDTYELRAVAGEDDLVKPGIGLPISETFCERVIETGEPLGFGDVATEAPELADRAAHEHADLDCYLGAPIVVDGSTWGSLCFFGREAREPFSAWDETVVELLAEWVGHELATRERRTDLERARASLAHTLERIDDAFVAVDGDWQVTYLNGRARELLATAEADLVGEDVWGHVPEPVCDQLGEPLRRALADQEPVTVEVNHPPTDRWYEVRAHPSETGLSVSFSDVTERNARERDLERYQVIVEAIDDGVAVLDDDYRIVHANEAAATLAGVDRAELVGHPAESFVPGVDLDARLSAIESTDGAATDTIQTDLERESGGRLPIEASVTRLERAGPDADSGYVAVIRDVSERRERETTVRRLLATTRALFACDTATEISETVTAAAADVFGYEYASVRLFDPGDDALVLEAATDRAAAVYGDRDQIALDETEMGEPFRRGEPVVLEDLPGGSPYDYGPLQEAMCIPIGSEGMLTVCSPRSNAFDQADVQLAELLTANAEAALEGVDRRETLLRYEQVLETVEGMVYALDDDGRFTLVTERFADRLGYDREELVGEHASILLDPDDVDRAVSCIRTLLSDPERSSISYEATLETALGRDLPVEIEMSLFPSEAPFAGTVGAVRDITERRERERYLQVLNRVLRHNLRNELTVVMGYAERLTEAVEDEALAETAEMLREVSSDLAQLSEDAKRIERTLRRGRVEGYPVELSSLTREVVERNRWEFHGADVEIAIPEDATAIADEELATALVHLVENAIEHNPDPEPTVRISAECDDRTVTLAVGDDGPGIPPSERGVITGDHDITQLTHGSGLGLWLVRWIVDSYGGRVEFGESDLGGSRVEVVLEAATPLATNE